jgi:hypothetical protein
VKFSLFTFELSQQRSDSSSGASSSDSSSITDSSSDSSSTSDSSSSSSAHSAVIITEVRGDGTETLQLIPHTCVQGDLPQQLVDDHSHWLYKDTASSSSSSSSSSSYKVLFRPVHADADSFNTLSGKHVPYELLLQRQQQLVRRGAGSSSSKMRATVRCTGTGALLLDVRSATFEHLYAAVFRSLEEGLRVHVMIPRTTASTASEALTSAATADVLATVVLPRMGLSFEVDAVAGAIFTRYANDYMLLC